MPKDTANTTDWLNLHKLAKELATAALSNRKDLAEEPLLERVQRVVRNVGEVPGFTENQRQSARTVAWLKDVLAANRQEFKLFGVEELLASGFPKEVVNAVVLLDSIKPPRVVANPNPRSRIYNYSTKVKFNLAVKNNPVARLVRIAYLADMLNLGRRAVLERNGVDYAFMKYELGLAILDLTEEQLDWLDLSVQRHIERSNRPRRITQRILNSLGIVVSGSRALTD